MKWEKEAERALKSTPFFARPLVRKKVEERVSSRGGSLVTLSDYREAEARFRKVMGGKSESELRSMMPTDNVEGASTVVVESCHNQLSNCPNPLIDTSSYHEALSSWAEKSGAGEAIRARIADDQVLYHHKFRVSISGCPNSCSRPQIADVGLVGFVEPIFDLTNCEKCGSCGDVCPDGAIHMESGPPVVDYHVCLGCKSCLRACPERCISHGDPRVRVLAGGKLGRHPHLAEPIAEIGSPAEAVAIVDRLLNDYLKRGNPGERFADFFIRAGKEAL